MNVNRSNVLGIHSVVFDLEIDHIVVSNEQLITAI